MVTTLHCTLNTSSCGFRPQKQARRLLLALLQRLVLPRCSLVLLQRLVLL
jgi:hypothetical protein